jgi:hypothetical protein
LLEQDYATDVGGRGGEVNAPPPLDYYPVKLLAGQSEEAASVPYAVIARARLSTVTPTRNRT